ncbi:MAG: vWA domain-containing protein [Pseudomonadota bacterium]
MLELGETETEVVTVTIPARAGVSKADVYMLADTTGSMDPVIAAVQAGANAILGGVPGGIDFAFGVGNYRDYPADDPPFTHQLDPDTNDANVMAAINAWTAGGGGDTPEGQLFALHMLGEAPGGAIGWRPDAKRIIVWFGDAPGHDPVCAALTSLGFDITEASATTRLVSENITVVAISTDTGVPNALDGDPTAGGDYNPPCAVGGASGQATRIAAATGGTHVSGINPADIVDTIIDLIEDAVLDINEVKLEPTGATASFVEAISPASYGPLPGDETHVLPFKVTWRGIKPCGDEDVVFNGGLNAVADDVVVARKPVRITVPACPPEYVYAVKYICGTAADCGCPEAPVRPGRYATEINLHNPSRVVAGVTKLVTPLVTGGISIGREPMHPGPVGSDRIKLQPHEATMDDCKRLAELHYGAPAEGNLPLTVGFLEVVSNQQLVVTAVYTATSANGDLTMDVETIQPIVRPQLPPRPEG